MVASFTPGLKKDLKVNPPDKGLSEGIVRYEAESRVPIPSKVEDLSSAAIHKVMRRPIARLFGDGVGGVEKPSWKNVGKNRKGRKPIRCTLMDVEEYDGEATEEGSEFGTDVEAIGGSDTITQKKVSKADTKVKPSNIVDILIPNGNTAMLYKNWEKSNDSVENLSPGSDMKQVISEMLSVNPLLIVNPSADGLDNHGADKSDVKKDRVVVDDSKDNTGDGNEFIPGIGFKFHNELKQNSGNKNLNEDDQMKGMEGVNDLDYLTKVNHWNDAGGVIVGSVGSLVL